MGASYNQMMFHNGSWVRIGGPSGGGTDNYNDLLNTPIKNVAGSSREYFVNISGLAYGHYNLSGYYKEDASSEIMQATVPLDLIVVPDDVTNEKIVLYVTVSNRGIKQHILVYDGSSLVEHIVKNPGEVELYWEE